MTDREEGDSGIDDHDETADSGPSDSDEIPDSVTSESSDRETVPESSNDEIAPEPITPDPEPMTSDTTPDADEPSLRNNVERYARYLLVAGLSLLALIAMMRFYFAASATIDTWISRDYRSLFQALFNLALLLLAGAGIAWQARKIR